MSKLKKLFSDYPTKARKDLECLRDLIHEVASNTKGVGEVEECLK